MKTFVPNAVVLGGLLSIAALLAPSSAHARPSLAEVQRAASAAGWVAGPTSVSSLSVAEQKKMLGVPMSLLHAERFRVKKAHPALVRTAAPASLDWRNMSGQNFVSPILDQGRCGSCVAFATIATLETQMNINAKATNAPFEMSPQYLFACGGGSCDAGWEPDSAVAFLRSDGVPDDACFPYASGAKGDDMECTSACSDSTSRAVRISGSSAGGGDIEATKAALAKGPLITTLTVYDDFELYTSGVYKHVTGDALGGHAVSIIGYSDADRAWIVRNSWGTGWGDNGFIKVSWDDVSGVGDETWGLELAPQGSFVAFASLRDKSILDGKQSLTFSGSGLDGMQVTWAMDQNGKPTATGASSDGRVASFDTTSVADGVYTIRPQAVGNGQTLEGEPRVVYVLNGTESGSVKFSTGISNNQTLNGVVTFDLAVTATPVPLTQVTFTVTDGKGTVVASRSTPNTGDVMEIGWNTAHVPNGSYTLKVEGVSGSQAVTPSAMNVTVAN
jgi:C1A family cysteine protease